ASQILLKTRAKGYLNQTKRVNSNFEGLKRDTIFMMKREINRTFVLENIYYDLDKWDILPEAEDELDKLVAIMKENPTLVVELGSHTDSRGSDKYNLLLSQRRSNSAVEYIVSQGISRSRIVAKGYGETQLVNHCSNGVKCSDSEHRKNRRTEFKILSWE
ncbi:MAG TPA: OmpA family protein, partial [Prolixibacteraceae bacterium]|nr:OmpA family protein [Prolixibacteraceae bacterium]